MSRQRATFDGVDLSMFSAYLASSNFLDGPKKRVNSYSIPGRSGNLLMEDDSFENFPLKAKIYITDNLVQNMTALRNYLNATKGYCKYTESLSPNVYRMACYKATFAPGDVDRQGGSVDLSFDCKPQLYLDSGDVPIACAAGNTVTLLNPTRYGSLPIVKVTGTGTFTIGNVQFTLTANTSVVTVDFERGTAYEETGLVDRNGDLTLSATDFPKIPTGSSSISATGCDLIVYPRWFML